VNVHGIVGQVRPLITSAADPALGLSGTGAKVSELTINHSGGLFGLQVFATGVVVQQVEVHSTGADACAIGYAGLARDLLCVTSAANGVALEDSWGGGGTTTTAGVVTLRNVTAIATGPGSYGIRADSTGDNTDLDVNARNVIASGVAADVRSSETGTNSESDISMAYTNYDSIAEVGGGNVTNVGSSATNQTAAPVFADTTGYHQAPTSPTVDKGTSDSSLGPYDLDGQGRRYGAAVDIGVDEWWPDTSPPDTLLDHAPKARTHKHKAVFSFHASEPSAFVCKLDKRKPKLCSSPLKLKHRKYGKHKLTITAVDASGNVDPTPVVYKWKIKHRHKPRHGHHPGHHHGHHHRAG
jgi:hypothetical protein